MDFVCLAPSTVVIWMLTLNLCAAVVPCLPVCITMKASLHGGKRWQRLIVRVVVRHHADDRQVHEHKPACCEMPAGSLLAVVLVVMVAQDADE